MGYFKGWERLFQDSTGSRAPWATHSCSLPLPRCVYVTLFQGWNIRMKCRPMEERKGLTKGSGRMNAFHHARASTGCITQDLWRFAPLGRETTKGTSSAGGQHSPGCPGAVRGPLNARGAYTLETDLHTVCGWSLRESGQSASLPQHLTFCRCQVRAQVSPCYRSEDSHRETPVLPSPVSQEVDEN